MDESFRISSTGKTIEQAFELAPEIFAEEAARGVTEATLLAEREIKEETPSSGAGLLRESIGATPVTITPRAISGRVVTSLSYAAPVEFGSKPHWAPIEPLLDWVTRKLGLRGDDADAAARAIRFKIAAHGTEGAHMFSKGLAKVEQQILAIYEAAARRALDRLEQGAR